MAVVRGVDCLERVFRLHVETVDVVQPTVPGFRDDGQRPPVTGGIGLAVRDAPLNHRVANDSDAVRVGDHHRALEEAGLLHPSGAGHFAISVLRKPSGEDRVVHGIFSARQNSGDAGADWTFADLQLAFTGNQGGVADEDAIDIGDGVEFSSCAVEGNAKIASARLFGYFLLCQRNKRSKEKKEQCK